MTDAPCRLLAWDTDHWGFPVATVVSGDRLDGARMAAIEAWCLRHRVRCLYFCAEAACPTTLATAAEHGFRFVDLKQELALELGSEVGTDHFVASVAVRAARRDDLPEARRLAAACHRDTRFFKDATFSPSKAAELYARWIDADFTRGGLLVATRGGGGDPPIGYVSLSRSPGGRGRLGLLGVGEDHRGRGVGAALLEAAIADMRECGCTALDVATQATNVGALRLYCRRGFLPSQARAWFHRWW